MNRFRSTRKQAIEGKSATSNPGDFKALLFELLEIVTGWIFAFGRILGALRWGALTVILAVAWVLLAMMPHEKNPPPISIDMAFTQLGYVFCQAWSAVTGPPVLGGGQYCDQFADPGVINLQPLLFEIPLQRLFRADVFQHILILAFAGWLAFKSAASYIRKVYDLPDERGAQHFILQGAFINPYSSLNISEGRVPMSANHLPIVRIGGPGMVWVHLENAALFERADASPHVVGPTVNHPVVLEGFERLRKVIDLRDQKEVFTLAGRSQDGIRVKAKDVHVVYSVFREQQQPTYERPYPYQDPQAIESLVYQQGRDVWNVDLNTQIRGALLDFFAAHPLNEFLAMVQEPELRKSQEYEYELMKVSQRLLGSDEPVEPPPIQTIEGIDYVPRPQITDLFYSRAEETKLARGIQIDWIGVGTWDFPAQVIRERHQDAWRITHENLMKNHPAVFQSARQQQKVKELLRLIRAVPIEHFRRIAGTTGMTLEEAMRTLILAYRTQMTEALSEYERAAREVEMLIQQEPDPVKVKELNDERERLQKEAAKVYEVVVFLTTRFYARYVGRSTAGGVPPTPPTGQAKGGQSP
jgi:hypothetical protein